MNKVLREAYFHISNGGCFIRVEEDERSKHPIFVMEWDTFGNLQTSFSMKTRKEYLHTLGNMLIEAADMIDDKDTNFYGTLAKMYSVKDENDRTIKEPMKEYGFLND